MVSNVLANGFKKFFTSKRPRIPTGAESSQEAVSHAAVRPRSGLSWHKVNRGIRDQFGSPRRVLYLCPLRAPGLKLASIVPAAEKAFRAQGSDDRNRPVAKPCQGNLRHAVAGLFRYPRFDRRDDSAFRCCSGMKSLHHCPVHAALFGRSVALILSGQHAAGQVDRYHAVKPRGSVLAIGTSSPDGSLDPAVIPTCKPERETISASWAGYSPERSTRQGHQHSDVEPLALANHVISPSHHFFLRPAAAFCPRCGPRTGR